MALLNIFDVARSAMTAQSQRLNVSASNLANASTPGFRAQLNGWSLRQRRVPICHRVCSTIPSIRLTYRCSRMPGGVQR